MEQRLLLGTMTGDAGLDRHGHVAMDQRFRLVTLELAGIVGTSLEVMGLQGGTILGVIEVGKRIKATKLGDEGLRPL
jgi:hypothetical protein